MPLSNARGGLYGAVKPFATISRLQLFVSPNKRSLNQLQFSDDLPGIVIQAVCKSKHMFTGGLKLLLPLAKLYCVQSCQPGIHGQKKGYRQLRAYWAINRLSKRPPSERSFWSGKRVPATKKFAFSSIHSD